MPRINPIVSQKAYDIVQKIPKMHKGEWVSDAIEEKHNRESGTLFTPEQEHKIRQWIREEIGRLKE